MKYRLVKKENKLNGTVIYEIEKKILKLFWSNNYLFADEYGCYWFFDEIKAKEALHYLNMKNTLTIKQIL